MNRKESLKVALGITAAVLLLPVVIAVMLFIGIQTLEALF